MALIFVRSVNFFPFFDIFVFHIYHGYHQIKTGIDSLFHVDSAANWNYDAGEEFASHSENPFWDTLHDFEETSSLRDPAKIEDLEVFSLEP